MGNLVIALITIVFSIALLAAGIGYIKPTAYIEHNQAANNTAQVESLVGDYNNLAITLGRRPTAQDFSTIYPQRSANSAYTFPGGVPQAVSTLGVGNWNFMTCNGGVQDCFCLTVPGDSANRDVMYKAAQVSAYNEMQDATQSRVTVTTAAAGCADEAAVIHQPANWPPGTPQGAYALKVYLNNSGAAATNIATSLLANPATVNPPPPCTVNCGPSQNVFHAVTHYTCPQNCDPSEPCKLDPNWTCLDQDNEGFATYLCGPQSQTEPCSADTDPLEVAKCTQTCVYNPTPAGCDANCGPTMQTVSNPCYGPPNNQPVDPKNCPGLPGPTTQRCNTNGGNDYSLCALTSSLGICAPNCSVTSTQKINYTCQGGTDAAIYGPVPPAIGCAAAYAGQPTSQSCPEYSQCHYTGVPAYTACNTTCGTDVETGYWASCTRDYGSVNSPGQCGTPPADKPCTDYSSCHYSGNINWGKCSSQCTNTTPGQQDGSYTDCTRVETGESVTPPATYCGTPTPRSCTDNSGCVTYVASNPQYQCSTTCGPGTYNLSYTCTQYVGGSSTGQSTIETPGNSPNCGGAQGLPLSPPSGASCNPGPCYTYAYVLDPSKTSSCSQICGPGNTTTPYRCQRTNTSTSVVDYPSNSDCDILGNQGPLPQPQTNYCNNGPCAVDGSCSGNTYTCATGTPSNTVNTGYIKTWSCNGSNGGNTASCNVPNSINGICASFTSYQCLAGTVANTNDDGITKTWSCIGGPGGSDSSCTTPDPINLSDPACGPTSGSCLSGTLQSGSVGSFTDSGGNHTAWVCLLPSYAAFCIIDNPTTGQCAAPVNTCAVGRPINSSSTATTITWSCAGLNGGQTSSPCTAPTPINGVCSSVFGTCNSGTLIPGNPVWYCSGINGGSDATCGGGGANGFATCSVDNPTFYGCNAHDGMDSFTCDCVDLAGNITYYQSVSWTNNWSTPQCAAAAQSYSSVACKLGGP